VVRIVGYSLKRSVAATFEVVAALIANSSLPTFVKIMKNLTLLFICLFLFSACQLRSSDDTASPTTSGTIIIRLAVTDQLRSQIQPLIAAFMAENDEIEVQFVSIEITDGETYHRTVAESADVFVSTAQRHSHPQYLLDLRPIIERDDTFEATDFYPHLLVEENGRVQTIPVSAAYHVIYYNKTLFDAAGLPYPENGWTLDQFLAAAQQLTRRDGDEVTQWGYLPAITIWSPFLATQLDAPIGQTDNPRFTDSDVIAAVDWLTELFTNYSGGSENSRRNQLIRNGQVAMWEGTLSSYQPYSSFIKNLGIVSMPLVEGDLFTEPLITGYSISAGTANAEAAWRLVRFLSRQPPVGQLQQYNLPARRSVAEAANYWSQLPADLRETVAYSAENGSPPQLWGGMLQIADVFPRIIDEGLTVEEALIGQAVVARPTAEPLVVATPEPTLVTATTIQFVSENTFQAFTHRRLAQAFHEAHPDIRVSIRERHLRLNMPFDPVAEIGEADCFLSRDLWIDAFIKRDLLLPIDALLELDATTGPEDFYSSSWAGVVQEGQRYGLPAAAVPRFILYDRAKFAAAGLPDPSPDWTLDELRQTAEALTMGTGDDKQYGFFDNWYRLARFYFNLELMDTTLDPPTLDYSVAAPALRWYIDLITLYGVHPALPIDSEAHRMFAIEGNYAMWSESSGAVPSADELEERNWGIVPLPVTPYGSGWRHPGNSAYFIMQDSEHRAACWQWITFLSRQHTAVDEIPARIEVAESTAYGERVGPEVAALYQAALTDSGDSYIFSYSSPPAWMEPGYRFWYDRALEQAILHGADLILELEQSQQHWDDYRACVIATDAFDNREAWVQCAIEVDPTLAGYYD
jgi:ABC-type glycerol-3-phosphate transport system substrate-binding protein